MALGATGAARFFEKLLQFLWGILCIDRCEHKQLHARLVPYVEHRKRKMHSSNDGVIQELLSSEALRYIMLQPPGCKLGTALDQPRNQCLEVGVTNIRHAIGAECGA